MEARLIARLQGSNEKNEYVHDFYEYITPINARLQKWAIFFRCSVPWTMMTRYMSAILVFE